MVAPGFRSRIATGLLVAAVVLPVPIGATSAAAADRRAPSDRPPHFVRPGDQPEDDFAQEEAGAEDYAFDGDGADDFAGDRRPVDGRGGEGRRRYHGRHGHPGAPARFSELPPRFSGMPEAFPDFPHRPSRHFGGPRMHGRWHQRPHHPFGPAFVGPAGPPYPLPGSDYGSVDYPRRGHHGPSAGAGSPDADRAYQRPGRRPPAPKHHRPSASAAPATGESPARSPSSHRFDVADRLTQHPYEALPPLPTPAAPDKGARSEPDSTDGDAVATAGPYALESPSAPVERVLPLGAGLALTGLGLAFFALRLRRS
ncbi:polyadenylate binding domain-containing protein [Streptomyces angustmyceticus]|uniref:hypothetical protein n=1 Tax=Streptomyces angustmyceticus TaxID=285578 RepID=UPI0037F84FCC